MAYGNNTNALINMTITKLQALYLIWCRASTNNQIMIKIPMTKILKIKILALIISTLGNWNLFGIWDLMIGI
jgi:hypothetical protein